MKRVQPQVFSKKQLLFRISLNEYVDLQFVILLRNVRVRMREQATNMTWDAVVYGGTHGDNALVLMSHQQCFVEWLFILSMLCICNFQV